MSTTESSCFMTASPCDATSTNVASEAPATHEFLHDQESRGKWQELIDHKLIEWGRNPSQFDDEGVEPPSGEIVRRAIEIAKQFRHDGLTPPDSIVPDPNGGIVFERREGDVAEVFHIWDDGTVEYRCFQGARLVERRTL